MATLYNCHHDGDQYRITKFNELGEPESSYLCTETECECPAGVRPTCRHRQMLPKFLAREAVDSYWFYDFDRGGWVTNEPAPQALHRESLMLPLPDGVQVFGLNDLLDVHNAIADAVGEPEARIDPDDYGEDPIGLESLPPACQAWRRI